MIDTIILRIHDTNKYNNLIKNLDVLNIQGITTESIKVQGSDVRKLRRIGLKSGIEIIDALRANRKGEFLLKTKVAKHLNASNHYSFAYLINYTADYIEFNFSIPKYNYGSNVLMFVDHIGSKDYSFHLCSQLEYNIDRSFALLEKFFYQFFRMEFPGNEVDYKDVEVNRIDVCFNQMFRSKQDALKYLEYQKRQRKKYARDEEGVLRDYATSLMYVSKRYSAKIYHKGTEYQKHDLKEHLKYNTEKKIQYFRTKEFQSFADKMLRYELTIRTGMLNYLHKTNLFRQNCPIYKKQYEVYQAVENSKQRNDRISKKIGSLPDEQKEEYSRQHPYDKITSESRRTHKDVSRLISNRTYFRLAIDEEARLYNRQKVDYTCRDAKFSRGLLKLCLFKLVDFMLEYQVKELPPEDKIGKLIDEYNLRHKKHLPKSEMMAFYRELQRIGSFKDTAKFNYLSRASLYRYKLRFKKIGITENNLIPLTEDGIPLAELDLREYHHEHLSNPRFLMKKNFLDIL